ncbi:MAG: helix-turn-helix transcriptional regulator [Bacteroidota bacterium]|nr:helix-turn-helix transcriptional regulator [Bacteroidota bacterium]
MYSAVSSLIAQPIREIHDPASARNQSVSRSYVYNYKWAQMAGMYDLLAGTHGGTLFVWDASNNEFIYISHRALQLTGYDARSFTGSEGMQMYLNQIHEVHQSGAVKIMQRLHEFRKGLKELQIDMQGYSASFDYIFRHKNGKCYRNLLCCMEMDMDATRLPHMVFNTHFDISHLRKSTKQTLVIKTPRQVHIFHYSEQTQHLTQAKSITKAEHQVLAALAAGKESKHIGNELFISPHTVDTHRRNLLNKLNCTDTTALVTFARMVGVI